MNDRLRPPPPHRRRWIAGVLALALAAGGGMYFALQRQQPVVTSQAPSPTPAEAQPAPLPPGPVETVPSAEPPGPPPISFDNRQSFGRAAGLHRTKDPLHLVSSAALVLDPQTGQVLYQKNEHAVLPIASLTKMMTALLVAEAKLPLEEQITITEEDVDTERNSRSRLRVGTTLTRGEALHLALMSSENRAAHALGRTYPGGMDTFVKAMNAKAKSLGMLQTTFVDPTGLSNRNQSTARDLATLVATTARFPLLREYSTTDQHQVALGGRNLRYLNSNRLVRSDRWDIYMQKTGYIIEAGQCVAMATKVAGLDVIMVLLDATDKGARSADAERIRRFVANQPGAEGANMAEAAAAPKVAKATKARSKKAEKSEKTRVARSTEKKKNTTTAKAAGKTSTAAGKTAERTQVAEKKKEAGSKDGRVRVTLDNGKAPAKTRVARNKANEES